MTVTVADRIVGCLKGIATGDAIGKQTETLSHEDVLRWYPQGIRGFEGTPGSIIPRYVGNAKREWQIGETTDDTEMTVAVARAILTDRSVSHVSVGRDCSDVRSVSIRVSSPSGNFTRPVIPRGSQGAMTAVEPRFVSHRLELSTSRTA